MLTVAGVHAFYGNIEALRGIDLEVEAGEIVTLIGANGAGKSTTLRAVAGALLPRRGTIRFAGRDVTRMPSHERAGLGIALVPEGRRLFPSLTVEENLKIGGQLGRRGPWDLQRVYSLFPVLAERRHQRST